MPGKSRHGKGKHPHYSKKSKIRQRQAGAGLPQQAIASVPKTTAPISPQTTPKTAPPATTSTVQYPNIINELKRIGILTGIIIIILIILSIVLS